MWTFNEPVFLLALVLAAVPIAFSTLLSTGLPWVVIGVVAIAVQFGGSLSTKSLVLISAPALSWLGLSIATGNRELFFSYTMYLATASALPHSGQSILRGTAAGFCVVVPFMIIRILQDAPRNVLQLEFGVALVILELALAANMIGRKSIPQRTVLSAAASLLAFASLSL